MSENYIFIENFKLYSRIGVTDQERSELQEIKISLKIYSDFIKPSKSDDVVDTINYEDVYISIKKLVLEREWKLVESMGVDIINLVKNDFKAEKVEIKISKFILDSVESVGVKITL